MENVDKELTPVSKLHQCRDSPLQRDVAVPAEAVKFVSGGDLTPPDIRSDRSTSCQPLPMRNLSLSHSGCRLLSLLVDTEDDEFGWSNKGNTNHDDQTSIQDVVFGHCLVADVH